MPWGINGLSIGWITKSTHIDDQEGQVQSRVAPLLGPDDGQEGKQGDQVDDHLGRGRNKESIDDRTDQISHGSGHTMGQSKVMKWAMAARPVRMAPTKAMM